MNETEVLTELLDLLLGFADGTAWRIAVEEVFQEDLALD